jgi:hypothetical protein
VAFGCGGCYWAADLRIVKREVSDHRDLVANLRVVIAQPCNAVAVTPFSHDDFKRVGHPRRGGVFLIANCILGKRPARITAKTLNRVAQTIFSIAKSQSEARLEHTNSRRHHAEVEIRSGGRGR